MARYTGPRDKVSRRFGVALFGSTKALEKRPFPPGQHGMRAGRKKKSDYGVMLAEKQKLRFQYGVLEGQFRKYYAEAAAALPAIFCFSSLSFVWTMLCTASASAIPVPAPVSLFPTVTSP